MAPTDSSTSISDAKYDISYKSNIVFFKKFGCDESCDYVDFLEDPEALRPKRRMTLKDCASDENMPSRTTMMKRAVKVEQSIKWHPANNIKKTLSGQKFDKSIVRNQLRSDLEEKVRAEVEHMMTLELQSSDNLT